MGAVALADAFVIRVSASAAVVQTAFISFCGSAGSGAVSALAVAGCCGGGCHTGRSGAAAAAAVPFEVAGAATNAVGAAGRDFFGFVTPSDAEAEVAAPFAGTTELKGLTDPSVVAAVVLPPPLSVVDVHAPIISRRSTT